MIAPPCPIVSVELPRCSASITSCSVLSFEFAGTPSMNGWPDTPETGAKGFQRVVGHRSPSAIAVASPPDAPNPIV